MKKTGNVVGKKPSFVVLDRIESLDIDEIIDFEFGEYLFKQQGIDSLLE